MFRRHCTDEELLQLLDGELSWRKVQAVKRHTRVCWSCRGRLRAMEEQISKLAAALDSSDFAGADFQAASLERFSFWQEKFERDFAPAPQFQSAAPRGPVWRWAAAAAVVLIAAYVFYRGVSPDPAAEAMQVVSVSQEVESSWARAEEGLHQRLRVEVIQVRPAEQRSTSLVEVWSDPDSGRFAWRWKNARGGLKRAIWQSAPDEAFVYDPEQRKAAPKTGQVFSPAALAELANTRLTAEDIERSLWRWLSMRRWKPVSLAAETAVFSSAEGVDLRLEKVSPAEGGTAFRVVAESRRSGRRIEWTLEVDAATYQPRSGRLRLSSPDTVFELRIEMEEIQALGPAEFKPAVFEPEVPLANVVSKASPALERQARRALGRKRRAGGALPSQQELLAAALEARYHLHRLDACRGEPLQVIRTESGVEVRGVTPSTRRKRELKEALRGLGEQGFVTINIQTVQESIESAAVTTEGRRVTDLTDMRRQERAPYAAGAAAEIRRRLKKYLDGPAAFNEMAHEIVGVSEAQLVEIWAVRRLLEDNSFAQTENLPLRFRQMAETMLSDHIKRLGKGLERMRPAIRAIVEAMELQVPSKARPSPLLPKGGPCPGACGETFALIQRLERLLAATFAAGPRFTAEAHMSSEPRPGGEPVALAREVVAALERLENALKALEAEAPSEFRGSETAHTAEN